MFLWVYIQLMLTIMLLLTLPVEVKKYPIKIINRRIEFCIADFNNNNDGTSGKSDTRIARELNEFKAKDPLWIKKQQDLGKIPKTKSR